MKNAGGLSRQIPFAFNKNRPLDFSLFIAGENESLLTYLKKSIGNAGAEVVYIWGATGSGKSHLLEAYCQEAASMELKIAFLPLRDAGKFSPEMLESLEEQDIICIDDVDRIAGNDEWEQAVFHLYNRVRDAGKTLIMTAQQSPAGSPVQLADLKSRFAWGQVFHLQSLKDNDVKRALRRHAESRAFTLSDDVADYLLKRVSRDMHSLFKLLDKIDEASLVEKKRLTIPFVKNLIE